MCGLNFTTNPKRIGIMQDRIQHRGLLGRVLCSIVDDLAFGHARLPIQNLSADFDQPYRYKNYIILFVGEILNYKELDPSAESDVQVLAKFWDKIGINAFKYNFHGFWSVVIYDTNAKLLHIITDPLAYKPLYIRTDPYLEISSEIKALAIGHTMSIDPLYFSSTAKWGYHFDLETFDTNIKKIPPGYYIVCKIKNPTIWHFLHSDTYFKLHSRPCDIKNAITDSVILNTVSDIPIGLLLSGGLDSSILFYLLEKITHDFTLFHIENNEDQYLQYLDIPSDIKLIKIKINPNDYNLSDILYVNESPFDLGSMIPQYLMAKEIAKQGIRVVLSGDGADELFGGYRRTFEYDSQYSDIFQELVYYHIPRLDKMMMNYTIELRCPYLDKSIIEHALSLQYPLRINKTFLRELFKKLPREITHSPKRPLKSNQVLNVPNWRFHLIEEFKKILPRFYIPINTI